MRRTAVWQRLSSMTGWLEVTGEMPGAGGGVVPREIWKFEMTGASVASIPTTTPATVETMNPLNCMTFLSIALLSLCPLRVACPTGKYQGRFCGDTITARAKGLPDD